MRSLVGSTSQSCRSTYRDLWSRGCLYCVFLEVCRKHQQWRRRRTAWRLRFLTPPPSSLCYCAAPFSKEKGGPARLESPPTSKLIYTTPGKPSCSISCQLQEMLCFLPVKAIQRTLTTRPVIKRGTPSRRPAGCYPPSRSREYTIAHECHEPQSVSTHKSTNKPGKSSDDRPGPYAPIDVLRDDHGAVPADILPISPPRCCRNVADVAF